MVRSVVRFDVKHAHVLQRYNDRTMTRGQTTCGLGGTLFHSYNFYCRFPENDSSFNGLLTLLRKCVCIPKKKISLATPGAFVFHIRSNYGI